MIGMFLFGGKKEKKKRVEEKKLKLPESVLIAISRFHARANKGYIKLVTEADPENNENRVMKILDAKHMRSWGEGDIYLQYTKKIPRCWHERRIRRTTPKRSAHRAWIPRTPALLSQRKGPPRNWVRGR